MNFWSNGGASTHTDTMLPGSKSTGTSQTIWSQTLWNAQSNKYKSTNNTIQQWERTVFPTVANMEEVIHYQQQCAPCLQRLGLSYPSCDTSKYSAC